VNFIVIGATRGLGYQIVRLLLEDKHNVAAGSLETTPPETLMDLKGGGNLHIFPSNVTEDGQLAAGTISCQKFFRNTSGTSVADALCNVATILLPHDKKNHLLDCDPLELRFSFEVNTIGAILVAKYFHTAIKKGGKLLTVTGKHNKFNAPCYSLSKQAATKISGILNKTTDNLDFYSVCSGNQQSEQRQELLLKSAKGIINIMTGVTAVSRAEWHIDYNGFAMPLKE